jgi:hypothetical protein
MLHRAIVAVDIDRSLAPSATYARTADMRALVRAAFIESGIDVDRCRVEDRGVGALIVLPSGVPAESVSFLPDRLATQLRRYNASRVARAGRVRPLLLT